VSSPLHRARFWLDHRWAPRHLSAYVDDELGAGPHRRMAHHVGECEECRQLVVGLRELIRMLHVLPTPIGPDAGRIVVAVRLRIQALGSS
jgi:anti-sigma factor RsiW